MRAHTHTDTHTRITESVVASIHYYDNVAPFCPKIIFKVDGITCINNFTHTHRLYMFICIVRWSSYPVGSRVISLCSA